jgi:UDP-N-acetylglucosamine diphosphorylase / glucose-1-phosphate thymidylyltransferase / UDP-N-acetylgalactosamine diphosphorylase / glucosamine-1-phosphate N-acetyltransferase / galactosamine-1-phosphate N-acetyltransferase
MKALILAGGRGSRLENLTKEKNKSLIKLLEKPIIGYNLDTAVKAGVSEIVIVIGYMGNEIKRSLKKEYKGIPIKYSIQKEQKGLVNAIECAKNEIGDSDFILMLGDEIIPEARIKEMIKKFHDEDLFAICGIVYEEDKRSIGKTYSAMTNEKGRVFRLIEKPTIPINRIKGTGHCILKNGIFDCIEKTPINANRGEKELVDLIQVSVDNGKKVYVYPVSNWGYVNVNTKEDYELAKELIIKSNPRVLIIHPQMKYIGGAELLVIELANSLTKKGVKNDILTLSVSDETKRKLINTKIIIPKNDINLEPPGFKKISEIIQFIKIFRKALRRIINQYEVINFHNFPVTWTLFPRKKPCVWMLNEPPNLWSKPNAGIVLKTLNHLRNCLDKKIVRNSVDIICVSDELNYKRTLERYGRKSRIIYYGVNYDFFSKGNANNAIKKFDLKNKFVIAQSGMVTEQKNQLQSVIALNEIKDKVPHALMVFAGEIADVKYKERIEEYIKKNNLQKKVLFTGNLNKEDLRDLYKASNVGIFPIKKQGGWLAPFELLCSGNPIIVSEEMGAASIIKKFNLGIVSKDYSEALLEIYNNNEKWEQQAKNSARIIEKNFSWDIFTDKMIQAYKDSWKKKN